MPSKRSKRICVFLRRRKVSLSDFKGKTYVAVREFYIKDNQELPGQVGLRWCACRTPLFLQHRSKLIQKHLTNMAVREFYIYGKWVCTGVLSSVKANGNRKKTSQPGARHVGLRWCALLYGSQWGWRDVKGNQGLPGQVGLRSPR